MMTTLRALYPRAAWRPSSDHVNGFAVFAHVVPVEAAESVRPRMARLARVGQLVREGALYRVAS